MQVRQWMTDVATARESSVSLSSSLPLPLSLSLSLSLSHGSESRTGHDAESRSPVMHLNPESRIQVTDPSHRSESWLSDLSDGSESQIRVTDPSHGSQNRVTDPLPLCPFLFHTMWCCGHRKSCTSGQTGGSIRVMHECSNKWVAGPRTETPPLPGPSTETPPPPRTKH